MKNKKVKGFTLIELLVVITIIGVLAAVLIPMISGYIKKSYKKSDVSAGNAIGKAAVTIIEDSDADHDSFYAANANVESVQADTSGGHESYDLTIVAKSDAGCTKWIPVNADAQQFCDDMNSNDFIGKLTRVKYSGKKKAKIWIIGYRDDDLSVEVWTADGSGATGGHMAYRVWQSADGEYT